MGDKSGSRFGSVHISGNDIDTTFLFSTPSLLSGMARMLDIYGQLDSYNISETEEMADAKALYSDFRIVGQDLRQAIESLSDDKDDPIDHHQLISAFCDLKRPLNDAGRYAGQ